MNYYRAIYEAVPSPILIVDSQMQILDANPAGLAFLANGWTNIFHMSSGEALHCINSINGCGSGKYCHECVLRKAVINALQGGKCTREHYRMEVQEKNGESRRIHMLVSATPLEEGKTILILEDITQAHQIHQLIPICAKCKKIRNEQDAWQHLENYMQDHHDLTFSHGLCPNCVKELFPELEEKKRAVEISLLQVP